MIDRYRSFDKQNTLHNTKVWLISSIFHSVSWQCLYWRPRCTAHRSLSFIIHIVPITGTLDSVSVCGSPHVKDNFAFKVPIESISVRLCLASPIASSKYKNSRNRLNSNIDIWGMRAKQFYLPHKKNRRKYRVNVRAS